MSESWNIKNLVAGGCVSVLLLTVLVWWFSRDGGTRFSGDEAVPMPRLDAGQKNGASLADKLPLAIDELPRFPGSKVVLDQVNPGSRVIHAETRESFDAIFDFYRKTLMEIGWDEIPSESFRMPRAKYERGKEQLVIEIQPAIRDKKLIKLIWRQISTEQ